jgi:crotonobetainyl-CoA:carnitine CoA-transferase CaiB-like acyl-CoA transferase
MNRPLSDVTVVELTHIIAGPYCGLLLADLGADVIKVEHPERADVFRDDSRDSSSWFNYVNRNKRGITLDLKDEEGHAAFEDLVAEADVVVENFGPGAVERLGVDYDSLRAVNSGLVYCSIKGFGEGPYEGLPALDPVAEALSGLMSTTGYPEMAPARCGTSVADMAASMQGALAVVGAIRQRDRTGEGQHVTAPMFESMVGLNGGNVAFSDAFEEPRQKYRGGGQGQWAPYGVFESEEGEWVFVGPSSERHWESLCAAMDFPGLADDERFRTRADRRKHRETLDRKLESVFAEYPRDEIVDRLQAEGVPCAPVRDTQEVSEDPHLEATDGLGEVTAAQGDRRSMRVPKSPIRSSEYEPREPTDPPLQGEHTEAVLEAMGYSEEEIETLRERDAI